MKRDLLFVLIVLILIGIGACVEPVPADDSDLADPDPIDEDPVVVVSVSASSDDGNLPVNVIDGSLSTRWSALGVGEHVEFEFDDEYAIGSMSIAWYRGDQRTAYFSIEERTRTGWRSVVETETQDHTLEHQMVLVDRSTRGIRIVGLGNSQNEWNSITDVRFDDQSPTYAPVVRRPELRGNPSFDRSQLTDAQAYWYDLILEELNSDAIIDKAASGDTYTYGRTLHRHVQAVLTVFRLTGDLALLDHVDGIAQTMRGELSDEWRGTIDGTDGEQDGYVNWVRHRGSDQYTGKDTWKTDEMGTHALVASIAYALEANRDLESPSGRDYGAHADFWEDYLVNTFEAKWREREDKAVGFPIMTRPHTASYYRWVKWHHYMGLLTGDDAYTREAHRMADVLWSKTEIRPISLPSGTAYVWPRSVISLGGSGEYLMPITYASPVYAHAVEFHFEGFHNWATNETMRRYARTMTDLIMDSGDPIANGFASDVGGGVDRAGIVSDPSWSRMSANNWRHRSFPQIAAWDESGRVVEVSESLVTQDRIQPVVGLFIAAWYEE